VRAGAWFGLPSLETALAISYSASASAITQRALNAADYSIFNITHIHLAIYRPLFIVAYEVLSQSACTVAHRLAPLRL
jgi:hypothetical protein